MPKRAWWIISALAGLWLAGCGYVGEPLPPSLSIPQKITDLHAYQHAGKLIVDFAVPGLTTDNTVLKRIEDVDLRLGAPENWAQGSKIPVGVRVPGAVHLEVPTADWTGKEVVLGARTESRRARFGEWSNLVRLTIVAPLDPPANLTAEGTADGVRVRWTSAARPGLSFRLFRRGPGQDKPAPLATSAAPEYLDATAQFGAAFEYTVQAAQKAGDAEAESAVSAPVSLTYEDRFPPAVPTGLSIIAGIDSIQLTWDPVPAADLRGYFIYRAVGSGPFARIGELTQSPSYTDRTIESGKLYRYAVSAVDEKGNESARTAPVEATAP